jgi:hypothetical protein
MSPLYKYAHSQQPPRNHPQSSLQSDSEIEEKRGCDEQIFPRHRGQDNSPSKVKSRREKEESVDVMMTLRDNPILSHNRIYKQSLYLALRTLPYVTQVYSHVIRLKVKE